MDYRALGADGATYDAVVSVEMIEAVGHEFWGTYFRTIDRVLAPGGKVAIQAITMPHDRMLATRDGPTPGSTSTSSPAGSCRAPRSSTRSPATRRTCGSPGGCPWAATTPRRCDRWDRRSWPAATTCSRLGFDDLFMRIWHFYLAYSQAGFASGYIDVQQMTFGREA